MSSVPSLLTVCLCVSFASCSLFKPISKHTQSLSTKTKSSTEQMTLAIRNWLPGSSIPVVKVKPDSLQPLVSGHERAVAYQKNRSAFLWFNAPPVNLPPPNLQSSPISPDAGLLPPLE